jgi:hypothetical protein
MSKKQLSLKPVEEALERIVKKLEAESKKAPDKKKTMIDGDITAIKALIKQVPPACRKYNVG